MSTLLEETLASRQAFEDENERVVRAEVETFRAKAQEFLEGKITDDDFRPFRLKHGCYGQRQPGVQMIRVKVPGGLATAAQIDQFAAISDQFAGGKGHLTTRQNIQYHFVPLGQVADLMTMLVDVGLTNREACYNTVRNVTACVWAGISQTEVFDVRPYAQKMAYAFLRQDVCQSLPRKFKIAFDGCAHSDCIAASINDLGIRAVIRDGQRGFRITVGGGLGPLPTEPGLLEEFVPEEDLMARAEAVVRVFNQYGNRKNRNTARLKFVLRERGIVWLKEQVEKEFQDIRANGGIAWPAFVPEGFGGFQSQPKPLGDGALLPVVGNALSGDRDYDAWLESNVVEQKQTGYAAAIVKVDQGNLTSSQMRGVAEISRTAGDSTVLINIDQNLILPFIPLARLRQVYAALAKLALAESGARTIDDVVTCPGAYSCNLALTKTMNLGAALQEAVRRYDDPQIKQLTIRASGCPNSCGQHWIGDIGFYGNARKIGGKEVPYYQMLLGGGQDENGLAKFGLAIQSVPARLAPQALAKVLDHFVAHREAGETFRVYVLRNKVETFRGLTAEFAKPADLFPEIYQDWGDSDAFSLQLGRGECAA